VTAIKGYAETAYGQPHYAETGTGPVLLLLHQTPRSHDEFREVQPLLATGRRVIAMDMLGFGMSAPLAPPQTIEPIADGAFALLDALGVAEAAVLGHHTGGVVAIEMTARRPERIRALIPGVDPAEGHRACARYRMADRAGLVTAPVLLLAGAGDPFSLPALPVLGERLTNAASIESPGARRRGAADGGGAGRRRRGCRRFPSYV